MRRRFLPLAAAFSMMAAAADEQQAVGARESDPHPTGERFSPEVERRSAAPAPQSRASVADAEPAEA